MEILIGKTVQELSPVSLPLMMANRHGLIAGATGTGKTVTLQTLAEQFSRAGVPVFTVDIKGDLSGIARPGCTNEKALARFQALQLEDISPLACPVTPWDLYGERGVPVRTTISEVGPLLLGRILELNETQSQVLQMIFQLADDRGLLLLDLKDLKALLAHVLENSKELRGEYGNLAPATLGAIQRALVTLSERGGETFFGEPALRLDDLLRKEPSGNGVVSLLDATKLLQDPLLYTSFLLWLLSELFEELPEVGDLQLPKLVLFFDEAHLLFTDTPKSLIQRIEQVVRLIRSKGVGVFFVTQNPVDIPESVLAQLGTRIQHALRAYTPKEQKAVRAASESFRANPAFSTESTISELGVGEALVSALDPSGKPQIVQHTLIVPPRSQIGPLSESERSTFISGSPLKAVYGRSTDRESAFELLQKRVAPVEEEAPTPRASQRQSATEAFFVSLLRSVGSQIGREIIRGVLGTRRRSSSR